MKSFPIVILDGGVVIQAQQDAVARLLLLRRGLLIRSSEGGGCLESAVQMAFKSGLRSGAILANDFGSSFVYLLGDQWDV